MSTPVIAIIGGGFCGMMTAVHLCRQAETPLHIVLINKGNPIAKGVAFNAPSNEYLLNVRAKAMGAFPDQPDHFLQWLTTQPGYVTRDTETLGNEFVPRALYGSYLTEIWQKTLDNKASHITLDIIEDSATDIESGDGFYHIHFEHTQTLSADCIVLATGNSQPRPPVYGQQYYSSPWSGDCINNTKGLQEVLIAGNGLTMADTVLGLRENGFTGIIHTVSPHGFALRPHVAPELSYSLSEESIASCVTLQQWKRQVYKQASLAAKASLPAELVVDALRPYTAQAWQRFSLSDKQQFLRQLGHRWNIMRHRLPLPVYQNLLLQQQEQQLVAHMGFIQHAETDNTGNIHVTWYNRKTYSHEQLVVQRIINCTGPDNNIAESSNLLLRNLSNKGFIKADALKLGIAVNKNDYSIVDSDGHNHKQVVTLGNSLKGLLWESTAVPELRKQSYQTALYLLQLIQD